MRCAGEFVALLEVIIPLSSVVEVIPLSVFLAFSKLEVILLWGVLGGYTLLVSLARCWEVHQIINNTQ